MKVKSLKKKLYKLFLSIMKKIFLCLRVGVGKVVNVVKTYLFM